MKRLAYCSLLAPVLAVTAGCDVYFGDDDDCDYGGTGAELAPALELRDPYSGLCEYQYGGGGGGGGCYAPAGDREAPDPIDTSDWAVCWGYCEGLDEASCLTASGCRGAYIGDCPEGADCAGTTYNFFQCWATAPSGPISEGECWGLDALECSRHDNCVARHFPDMCPPDALCDPPYALGFFDHCAPEDVEPPPPPPPACEALADEDQCIANECTPVYEGVGCSCDDVGCTCDDWLFVACER